MKKKTFNFIVVGLLIALVFFSSYGVFSLKFLNDEWRQLGYVRGAGIFAGLFDKYSVAQLLIGKGRFFGSLINDIFFYYFWENPLAFQIFGIVFHTLNTVLVYFLAKRITKQSGIALLTACFFSVPAAAHQSISWIATTTQTVGGMTFVLLSLLYAIKGVDERRVVYKALSWLIAYIAFLFKESCFFVFPILFLLPYFLVSNQKIKVNKTLVIFFLLAAVFGLFEIAQLWGITMRTISTWGAQSAYVRTFINMIFYPLVSLSQFFIPFRFMLRFAPAFAGFYYSFMAGAGESNRSASVIVGDLLSVIFSFSIILVTVSIYVKRKFLRKSILFALLFYVLSFTPVAVFLYERNTSYIESRYLYFAFFPVSFMVGIMFAEIKTILFSLLKNIKIAWVITLVIFALVLYKQMSLLKREIKQNVYYGNEIAYVMNLIRKTYPTIPEKPIFLVEGDRNYYYSEINMPFQAGPGFMLELTFARSPVISKQLLKTSYLVELTDQGYKEVGNQGFGYFRNRSELVDLFRSNPNLSVNQIVGMYYHGNDRTLSDTTESIRAYIQMMRNRMN
jgi:Dolichyl-phosphate-mannose-protein mannosyltransferase